MFAQPSPGHMWMEIHSNSCPCLGQAHKCRRVRLVNGITTFPPTSLINRSPVAIQDVFIGVYIVFYNMYH
jgi:hypothetical protein